MITGARAQAHVTHCSTVVTRSALAQEHLPVPLWQRVVRFCLHNWEKVIILLVLLVLIILVSVKVRRG